MKQLVKVRKITVADGSQAEGAADTGDVWRIYWKRQGEQKQHGEETRDDEEGSLAAEPRRHIR